MHGAVIAETYVTGALHQDVANCTEFQNELTPELTPTRRRENKSPRISGSSSKLV
jgi:hypothetical protein